MLSDLLTTDPVRAATFLRRTAIFILFLALLMPPGMSATSGQAVAEGIPGAGRTATLSEGTRPTSDAHKWFISVITMHNCGPCERLKHDFVHAESLAALVNVDDRAESWSHFNVYHWEDAAHRRHWQHVRLTTFPTIVIQPPLSGRYGDSRTIVLKKVGYDGNDRQLAHDIRNAITTYVARLPDENRSGPRLVAAPAGPDRNEHEAVPQQRRHQGRTVSR